MRFLILWLVFPLAGFATEFQTTARIALAKDVQVAFHASAFRPELHKVKNEGGVVFVDGKQIYGTDVTWPKTKLLSASITISGVPVSLDVSQMYNPWIGKAPDATYFHLTPYEGGWLLDGMFSDAAGSYVARWRIIAGTAFREILSDDVALIHMLFP
jgi:hypothetical protein